MTSSGGRLVVARWLVARWLVASLPGGEMTVNQFNNKHCHFSVKYVREVK